MTNEMKIGLAVIGIAAVLLVWYWFSNRTEYVEESIGGDQEGILQSIAEYRTYMINQWLSLLAFWLGIKVDEAQTKLTCPGFNQNTVYFFHENLEIYAYFNWSEERLTVKTSVFTDEERYLEHEKMFSLEGKDLPTKELNEFINAAREEHYGCFELNESDVIAITQQIKNLAKGFPSDDAAKNHLFDNMADLMILMRKKKLRNNKNLMQVYSGLVYWLWNSYGKEFLEYLQLDEEPQDNKTKQEKVEGNK